MNEKEFTFKQVCILVLVIVIGIAFIETPAVAVWSSVFWKAFLLKIIIYGGVSEFIVLLLNSFSKEK